MIPQAYMRKADRALTAAQLLLANQDTDGACNRAYYAMFNAAHAALAAVRATDSSAGIRTHRGLIAAFGESLVKTGLARRELGRALNEVEEIRRLADYTGEEVSFDRATWAIQQARTFVEAMRLLSRPAK